MGFYSKATARQIRLSVGEFKILFMDSGRFATHGDMEDRVHGYSDDEEIVTGDLRQALFTAKDIEKSFMDAGLETCLVVTCEGPGAAWCASTDQIARALFKKRGG